MKQFAVVQPQSDIFPENIGMLQTTIGDVNEDTKHSEYGLQNLAFHVADFSGNVHNNRMNLLSNYNHEFESIHWLSQIHSSDIVIIDDNHVLSVASKKADAFITQKPNVALAIMTADCLPVLLTDKQGNEITGIHAGWRGLADGIIEKTIAKMQHKPHFAWIGSAIHQNMFEVGQIVYDAFVNTENGSDVVANENNKAYFTKTESQNGEQKYLADLPGLATAILEKFDVTVDVLPHCSYESDAFYSYRKTSHKDGGYKNNTITGRMASLIWIKEL